MPARKRSRVAPAEGRSACSRSVCTARSAPLRRVRWISQPPSSARADELDRIAFDRRHDDDHVAHQRAREIPAWPGRGDRSARSRSVAAHESARPRAAALRAPIRPRSIRRSPRATCRALSASPAPPGKMRAQPPPQVDRLADIQRATLLVAQDVDARRGRRRGADALARAAPALAAIFDDQRLRDQPPGQFGRRVADAEHLSGQARIIRRRLMSFKPARQAVTKHRTEEARRRHGAMVTRGARYNGAG